MLELIEVAVDGSSIEYALVGGGSQRYRHGITRGFHMQFVSTIFTLEFCFGMKTTTYTLCIYCFTETGITWLIYTHINEIFLWNRVCSRMCLLSWLYDIHTHTHTHTAERVVTFYCGYLLSHYATLLILIVFHVRVLVQMLWESNCAEEYIRTYMCCCPMNMPYPYKVYNKLVYRVM